MNILELSYNNYRNLNKGKIKPCEGINIINGDNAQGKTNLLEAIWLFTGGKSFRNSKDSEIINFENKTKAQLDMKFYSKDREQKSRIILDFNAVKNREFYLNRIKKKTVAEIVGNFCAVVFSPIQLSLIKQGPASRRKFLDTAICQISPTYVKRIVRYNKILQQRNTLIKNIKFDKSINNMLDIWDEKLADESMYILKEREKYCDFLKNKSKEFYKGISNEKEILDISYEKSIKIKENTKEDIYNFIKENISEDIKQGFTTKGIHRDDIDIKINKKSARIYASQGQQRSAVLAIKLGEAFILSEEINESPVLILDDVMSELDINRQNFLLENIKNWQVFISSCELMSNLNFDKYKLFKVKNGEIYC